MVVEVKKGGEGIGLEKRDNKHWLSLFFNSPSAMALFSKRQFDIRFCV